MLDCATTWHFQDWRGTARTATSIPPSRIQALAGTFSPPAHYRYNAISFIFQNGFLQFPDLVEASRPPRVDPSLANFQSASYKSREAGKPGYFVDYNLTLERSLTQNTLW